MQVGIIASTYPVSFHCVTDSHSISKVYNSTFILAYLSTRSADWSWSRLGSTGLTSRLHVGSRSAPHICPSLFQVQLPGTFSSQQWEEPNYTACFKLLVFCHKYCYYLSDQRKSQTWYQHMLILRSEVWELLFLWCGKSREWILYEQSFNLLYYLTMIGGVYAVVCIWQFFVNYKALCNYDFYKFSIGINYNKISFDIDLLSIP